MNTMKNLALFIILININLMSFAQKILFNDYYDSLSLNYPCVVLGESHDSENNNFIHLSVFKHLYLEYNYKNVFVELPRSSKRIFDQYLKSGNNIYLDTIMESFGLTLEDTYFFQEIYKMHKSDTNIHIVPFDAELQPYFTLNEILVILERNNLEKYFSNLGIEYIRYQNNKDSYKVLKKMQKNFIMFEKEISEKINLNDFYNLKYFLVQAIDLYKSDGISLADLSKRENYIYENYINYPFSLSEKNYIIMGRMHVSKLANIKWFHLNKNWSSFVSRISQNQRICSGLIYYVNHDKDDMLEDFVNSRIIGSNKLRDKYKNSIENYTVICPIPSEKRFDFIIINQGNNKKTNMVWDW